MFESCQTDTQHPPNEKFNEQIKLERYKFILGKINFLDSQLHNNLTTTVTVLTGLITLLSVSVLAIKESKIDPTSFEFSVKSISFICSTFCLYMIFTSIAIIRSWIDYRNEEVDFLNKISCDISRKKPALKNIFRWGEFYYMVFVMVIFLISTYISLSSGNFIISLGK